MDVFSICIKHLKDSMLEQMEKTKTFDISEKDVDFIITVPAIWGDAAKMFMREAAVKVILFVDLGGGDVKSYEEYFVMVCIVQVTVFN